MFQNSPAPLCSIFVLRIEWILTFPLLHHFERSTVTKCFSTPSRFFSFFGWHSTVPLFLQNGCYIMEIWTASSCYPLKHQSTKDTRGSPATGHTYNFRRWTPFLVTSTFYVSGSRHEDPYLGPHRGLWPVRSAPPFPACASLLLGGAQTLAGLEGPLRLLTVVKMESAPY